MPVVLFVTIEVHTGDHFEYTTESYYQQNCSGPALIYPCHDIQYIFQSITVAQLRPWKRTWKSQSCTTFIQLFIQNCFVPTPRGHKEHIWLGVNPSMYLI